MPRKRHRPEVAVGIVPEGKSTKRILWVHFTDTVVLIFLELLLEMMIRGLAQAVPDMQDILGFVHMFSKWFALAALAQFSLESMMNLAEKDVARVRRLFRPKA